MRATGSCATVRLAMLVVSGAAVLGLSGCGRSDGATSAGTSERSKETTTLGEGQAQESTEPALTEESCLLSDDLVARLLSGETASPRRPSRGVRRSSSGVWSTWIR